MFSILGREMNWKIIHFAKVILALSLILTLCTNNIYDLITPTVEKDSINSKGFAVYTIFYFFKDNLVIAQAISIGLLLFVLSGFLPFLSGLILWYCSFSFYNSVTIVDGGDQLNAVMSFIMIPILSTDLRKSVYVKRERTKSQNFIARMFAYVITANIVFMYFQAAVSKFKVEEWMDGTALYYWMYSPLLNVDVDKINLSSPILNSRLLLPFFTWSVLLLELFLCASFLYKWEIRRMAYWVGILFHFLILFYFNLGSFFMSTLVGLIFLTRQYEINRSTSGYNNTIHGI